MDNTQSLELGVLEWCNKIRFSMARDPGRAFLDGQIQKHGFDFLDDYLANVVSRPKEEPMYELLKTPGRRKDAPKRTRAATVAAVKARQVISTETKENNAPLNSFHKALLDAGDHENDNQTRQEIHKSQPNEEGSDRATRIKPQKIVTIADSPEHLKYHMNVDDSPLALPEPDNRDDNANPMISPIVEAPPPPPELPPVDELPPRLEPTRQSQDLSMIAEADEPNERSRQSIQPTPLHGDVTSDSGLMASMKDDGAIGALGRRLSASQFAVPAPSPLRKSLRPAPSVGTLITPSVAQTPGTAFSNKRTSWLTKAKETKALEMTHTGRQVNTHGESSGFLLTALPGSSKRKSGEMLGLGPAQPSGENSQNDGLDERHLKLPRLTPTPDLPDSTSYGFKDVIMEDDTRIIPKFQPSANHLLDNDHLAPKVAAMALDDFTVPLADVQSEGIVDKLESLKKLTMGARTAKSMGKSLGGGAAAELAKARAAAEARVAERNKEDGIEVVVEASPSAEQPGLESLAPEVAASESIPQELQTVDDRRLSLSELVVSKPSSSQRDSANKGGVPDTANDSTSTTPPNSPPPPPRREPSVPHPPVFSKPPAVFSAPSAGPSQAQRPIPSNALSAPQKEFSFTLPRANPFSLPAPMALGVPPALPSSSSQTAALSAQSSKASIFSDVVFDKDGNIPVWAPTTQDTDYSIQPSQGHQQVPDDLDDDDSWHVDAKYRSNSMWTPFGLASIDKDDTMTTSTIPSQKGGDTSVFPATQNFTEDMRQAANDTREVQQAQPPSDFDNEGNEAQIEIDRADLAMDADVADMSLDDDLDDDLDDIVAAGKATITLVERPKLETNPRSQSQLSTYSSSSSQSQLGFFGQASRLVSSVLGGGKKTKTEPVKSIQRAAAAAKKQQEEAERKASRLKEMETRRQQTMQRKADEEKARALEEERKFKEEAERRKKEREESTEKRSLRSTTKKAEDDTKSRKIVVEADKKAIPKRTLSKVPSSSRLGKPPGIPAKSLKSAMKPATIAPTAGQSKDRGAATPSNPRPLIGKGKGPAMDEMDPQPSQLVQSQMIHRANAHIQATQPREPPPVASESIELPDINSEYSDSEDEDRVRTYDPPQWAQSPELRQQLQQQSTVNPDHVFGPIVPLQIEDMFKTRGNRLKARSSSANWNNGDAVTAEEVKRYNEQMGFK